MDDYKLLKGYGVKLKELKSTMPSKGHEEEWLALYTSLKEGTWPISLESMIHTTRISILAAE
jgi:hypothetical protein